MLTPQRLQEIKMHPNTLKLVEDFSTALAEKLAKAEAKYGYSDGWMSNDWMDKCREELNKHIAKGDPLDVAAYCAFLWYHDESTASTSEVESLQSSNAKLVEENERLRAAIATPPAKVAGIDRGKKIIRRMETQEQRDYWAFIDKVAADVDAWPDWKRSRYPGGIAGEPVKE